MLLSSVPSRHACNEGLDANRVKLEDNPNIGFMSDEFIRRSIQKMNVQNTIESVCQRSLYDLLFRRVEWDFHFGDSISQCGYFPFLSR